ncbi:hypothetical protein PCANC_17290 [Puccinia coronata f. sp. avenae]|nr:hypothetical protein PCANC_17290 [Puccinia coronata f. sp. avenae]
MYDIHGIMWQPSDVQHLNLALIPPRSLAKRRRMHNAPLTLYATQEQNDEGGTFEEIGMDLALWTGDLEFAKINAAEAGDDTYVATEYGRSCGSKSRNTWCIIIMKNSKTAMELLKWTDLLKIYIWPSAWVRRVDL